MGFPIPGLDNALKALTDPDGPIAKQAESSQTLAEAMRLMNAGNSQLARAQYVLAESNNRLAQALEDAARAGVRL